MSWWRKIYSQLCLRCYSYLIKNTNSDIDKISEISEKISGNSEV